MLEIDLELFKMFFDVESEHFDKYIKILDIPLEENIYSEGHHVYPKSLYYELEEKTKFKIPLSYKNHFIAHYHLWKSANQEDSVYKMALAFANMFMRKGKAKTIQTGIISEVELELEADLFVLRKTACIEAKKGKKLTEEHKRKISLSITGEKNPFFGKKLSEEHKKKISLKQTGKTHSSETRRKISLINKGRKLNLTEEQKMRRSKAHKGMKHSDETKLKIRNSILGKKHTEETKRRYSEMRFNKPHARSYIIEKYNNEGELIEIFIGKCDFERRQKISTHELDNHLYKGKEVLPGFYFLMFKYADYITKTMSIPRQNLSPII